MGSKYNFEDRLRKRLSIHMANREETFKDDMEGLREAMKTARSPPGLLTVKIGEMDRGTYVPRLGADYIRNKERAAKEKEREKERENTATKGSDSVNVENNRDKADDDKKKI